MTKNKKKLRRAERRGQINHAVQSLVLTGLLLAGGAGIAGAASWGEDQNVTISDDTSVSSTEQAGNLTIDTGKTLTLNTEGQNILLTQRDGFGTVIINGTLESSGGAVMGIKQTEPYTYYGKATVTGKLELTSGGSLSMDSITISDGSHTISGQYTGAGPHPDNGAWRKDSMVYAGHDLTVTGATITLGDNGLLGVGSSETTSGLDGQYLKIGSGGSVNMSGSASGNASVLRVFSGANNTADLQIVDGGKVTVDASQYGVIASKVTTVSGGGSSISVASGGFLQVVDKLKDGKGAIAFDASQTTNGLVVSNATLNLTNGGRLNTENGQLTNAIVTIDGGIKGATYNENQRAGIYDTDNKADSGTLTLKNSIVKVANGGGIEIGTITMDGGTLDVSGSHDYTLKNTDQEWRNGSLVYASDNFTMTDGTINVGDSGMVMVDSGTSGNHMLTISGGTVNLNGSTADTAAMLRACADDPDTLGSNAKNATMKIGGNADATVNAKGYARMMSNNAIIVGSKGLLDVQQGAHLLVSKDSKTVLPALTETAALKVQDTILEIDGGTVKVAGDVLLERSREGSRLGDANIAFTSNGGTLRVDGNMDVKDGALNMSSGGNTYISGTLTDKSVDMHDFATKNNLKGTLYAGALEVSGGAGSKLTIDSTDPTTVGFYGLGKDKSFYNGEEIVVTGTGSTLNLGGAANDGTAGEFAAQGGSYDGKVTVGTTGGTLTVSAGDWALKGDVDVQSGGSLKVTGGKLDVSSGKLTVASGAAAFSTDGTGALTAKFSDFTTDSKTLNGTVKKTVTNDGTLVLTGAGDALDAIESFADLKKLTGAILDTGSEGTINIDGLDANKFVTDKTTLVDVSEAGGIGFEGSTVKAGTSMDKLAGNTAVKNVDATSVSGDTYTIDTTDGSLRLVGDTTGGQLVKVNDGTTVKINGSLTMGSATGKTGGGTLEGSVTKGATAMNGDFVITGDVGGAVEAAQNSSLTVGGDAGGAVKATGEGSSVKVGGDAKDTVTATGDKTTVAVVGDAAKAVTATGNGTTVTIGGDVTTGGVTATGNGTTVTIGGDVTTGGVTATGEGSSVSVVNNVTGDVTATTATVSVGGDLTTSTGGVTLSDSSLTVGGTLDAKGNITVGKGTDTIASTLTVGTLSLNGKDLFIDPSWVSGTYNPSQVAVATFANNKIDGNIGVGMNSQLTLGTNDVSWLDGVVREMGVAQWNANGIDSALAIYAPQTLGTGMGIVVDGTKTSTNLPTFSADTATFSGKSLLVINGAIGDAAALTSTGGTVTVGDGAKLRIVNPKAGTTYTVLDGFTGSTTDIYAGAATAWTGANLTTNSRMITLERLDFDTTTGTAQFRTVQHSATGIFPNMSQEMGGLVDSLYADGRNDVNAGNAGVRFVSRATSEDYMPDVDRVAPTLEGAAQAAAVGAVSGMTLAAADAGTGAVASRTSFASPLLDKTKAVALHMDDNGVNLDSGLSAGEGMNNGLGLWIMPLYQNNNVWGMKSGEFKTGYSGDLGGVALGADYTFQDMFRIGVALNIGGGYAESSGDFNKTNNSFNFWGVSLYGGWALNNFGLTADLGYTGNYNKLEQETPDSMDMGDLKSDVTSSVLTAGLRGEYKIETSVLDLVPHVGVRYTDLTINSYDVKSGGTVFSVDQSHQSIWTFPIGITASKTIETGSGWQFKPQVDFSIVPAAGDVKTKSNARIPGVGDSAELTTQVVDYMTYQGGIGFDVQKDNLSFGLNYTIQASEHRTGHGVFGTLRYEF